MVRIMATHIINIGTFRKYLTPGFLMGGTVGVANLMNWNQSPLYKYQEEHGYRSSLKLRAFFGLGLKSWVYGTFWPFACFGIVSDIFDASNSFDSHFVLFSKYGNPYTEGSLGPFVSVNIATEEGSEKED